MRRVPIWTCCQRVQSSHVRTGVCVLWNRCERDWQRRRSESKGMRERENEQNIMRESQGQRVIRLFFLSDHGNCQALGMKSDYKGV